MESAISKNREDVLKLRFAALPDDGAIYVTMYGYDHHKDKIIDISKRWLHESRQGDCLIFVYAMPGPEYNLYYFKDYGKTWAFSMEDFAD